MLLTGKTPQDLFDNYNNTWNWRKHAQVSSQLGDVLDRMLRYAPVDRFQSANEVLAALAPKPAPPPVIEPLPKPVAQQPSVVARFSTLELMGSALFTGFEGGILAIAIVSLLGTTLISATFWLILVGILLVAQYWRFIEKIDLVILAVMSVLIVGFVRQLNLAGAFIQAGNPFLNILILAGLTGLLALAIALLFRLIFNLISRFL
jgi:hypothetical protein